MQNEQTADDTGLKTRADIESQYRELKELRKQLMIEQSKLLQRMPVGTKH